jgi:hypothetical protein
VADASTQDDAEAAADTCDAACGSDFISNVGRNARNARI